MNAKKRFSKNNNHTKYANAIVEKLYQEIRKESPSFTRDLNPLDFLQPLFVQPDKTNERIAKQDGAFIIFGLYADKDAAEKQVYPAVYAEIRIENQEMILRELDALGINEASLFPELDKVAHYLKEQHNASFD